MATEPADSNVEKLAYRHLVTVDLRISEDFLNSHKTTIDRRLKSAQELLESKTGDPFSSNAMFGLNQCLHMASSIALLGSEPRAHGKRLSFPPPSPSSPVGVASARSEEPVPLEGVLDDIRAFLASHWEKARPPGPVPDPTTIVTVATLAYILNDFLPVYPVVVSRLQQVNWMIGREGMKLLGIG